MRFEHVAYPHIAQTIGLLDRYYAATSIGVDNGGNDLAVVQELLTFDKYKDLQLDGRLRGYDFGSMTTLAVRDGKEVRKRPKEFITNLINGALQRRQLVFPVEDLEIEDQFTTHFQGWSSAGIIDRNRNVSWSVCSDAFGRGMRINGVVFQAVYQVGIFSKSEACAFGV